jgi:hypothetical protein
MQPERGRGHLPAHAPVLARARSTVRVPESIGLQRQGEHNRDHADGAFDGQLVALGPNQAAKKRQMVIG